MKSVLGLAQDGSANKGKLLQGAITLELSYQAIACECAQWIESKNIQSADARKESVFLEPASGNLISADTLWNGTNIP